MQTRIGTLAALNRYPVKSFGGEALQSSRIEPYGLYGDRSHAFIDETKEGWDRYFTARTAPAMLRYKAALSVEEPGESAHFPGLRITAPDGRAMQWDDALLQEIQPYSRQKLTLLAHTPQSLDLLAVDTASVLIITDSSLRKLEAMWGKPLDPLRFRANMLITLEDGASDENGWLGKQLTIGSARLQVDECCERCSLITVDPASLERDPSLLRTVNERLQLNFGVYASVRQTGDVRVGDAVYLMD
ncbi:MOSC domain-containing protein [Paenibacillus montanisoli]|uniref:Sulfurase n=1 Tax=Paenibacillus montanisoli TaxID=2081970 RepID=A0A328TSZ2_9BACL|nr:MOSC domain-containing protein [Paenibacillus montanisoli]RAP73699.1 sulfurase [Paenibacillus montanisoli]